MTQRIFILLLLSFVILSNVYAQDKKEGCTDSDGGFKPYNNGTVTLVKDQEGNTETYTDYCFDEKLVSEYICSTSRLTGKEIVRESGYLCEYGCEDGKCLPQLPPILQCTDSDGGNFPENSGFIQAKIKTPNDIEVTLSDTCLNDEQLLEYFCSVPDPTDINMTPYSTVLHFCANGCLDGKCLPPKVSEAGSNVPTIKSISISKNPVNIDESFITQAFLDMVSEEGGICKVFINNTGLPDSHYEGDPTKGCHKAVIPKNYLSEELDITKAGTYSLEWDYFPLGCESSTLPCFSSQSAQFEVLAGDIEGPPNENPEASVLENILNDLSNLADSILSEAEEQSIKQLSNVGNKLKQVTDLIQEAIDSSHEGDLDTCDSKLSTALDRLDIAITKLEAKQCKSKKVSLRRCIPKDLVESFSPDLNDIFNSLDNETEIDNNDDGMPDVCGTREE